MFSEFQPISKAKWLEKIKQDLKGKPLSDLVLDIGGAALEPFCHPDDIGALPAPMPANGDWEIGEDIDVTVDTNKANRRLIAALENGVNAPRLILHKNISYSSLAVILEGVNIDMISVHFYFKFKNANPLSLLSNFIKFISLKRIEMNSVKASISWEYEKAVSENDIRKLFEKIKLTGINLKILTVNGEKYYSENRVVNELAAMVADGEKKLNQLNSRDFSPAFIHQYIQFSVPVGKNFFLQIAKIRALKICWANVMKAYQISGKLPTITGYLAAESQSENKNTNMIAATFQAMSAIIGGVDRLTVLPSDLYAGESSDFSRRIARNVQHLLKMESGFDRVADPGAGSYYIEKLSELVATKVWEKFIGQE